MLITDEQNRKIELLFNELSKLENSDTCAITPVWICKELVSQKFDINLKYIDTCCGKGTILGILYLEFFKKLEYDDIEEANKYIMEHLCGVDISLSQLQIAQKTLINIQKILGIKNFLQLNVYNYNILDEKNNENIMKKFDVVITNPPYNSERGDNNQSVDIYPDFIDKAFQLTKRYVIMITKSNWMNFPSHKIFREKMINGYNVDKIVHYSENPFKGTNIQGGVSYFVIDNENTKNTFELNGITYDRKTSLHFLPYELNFEELKFLDKIMNFKKVDMINYRSKGFYNIKSNDVRLIDNIQDGYIKCHVSEQKGEIKYFPKSEINNNIEKDFDKYKVFTTSSYGTPNKIGRIFVGRYELNSESLVNWVFNSEKEMNNWYDYMNTKLFRVCVSMIKNKKDISKITFSLIPHIDFSKLDKVNDENIYKYLNLTEDDIKIIEDRCERLKLI